MSRRLASDHGDPPRRKAPKPKPPSAATAETHALHLASEVGAQVAYMTYASVDGTIRRGPYLVAVDALDTHT